MKNSFSFICSMILIDFNSGTEPIDRLNLIQEISNDIKSKSIYFPSLFRSFPLNHRRRCELASACEIVLLPADDLGSDCVRPNHPLLFSQFYDFYSQLFLPFWVLRYENLCLSIFLFKRRLFRPQLTRRWPGVKNYFKYPSNFPYVFSFQWFHLFLPRFFFLFSNEKLFACVRRLK